VIERALTIEGWMSAEELTWLAEQAGSATKIAEIGSWRGRSTAALSDNTTGTVWAIDTWEGSPETDFDPDFKAGGPEWLYGEFTKSMRENVKPVRLSSVEAAYMFEAIEDRFDLIFIDGAHDYASVVADISAWRPLLAEGGTLCGHDYWPGSDVRKAVDELLVVSNPAGSIWREKKLVEL
jgi:predicted O-methyltransferase YrrM